MVHGGGAGSRVHRSRPRASRRGRRLELVTKAGFSFLMANINYLRDKRYEVQRIEEDGLRDSAIITTVRPRPVLPGKRSAAGNTSN